jgi:hypothetical protein
MPLFEGIAEGAVERGREVDQFGTGLEAFQHVVLHFELVVTDLGGLDAQADAVLDRINLHNAGFDGIADIHDILDALNVLVGDLADVHQAIDAFLDFDECAERGDLRNDATDLGADRVAIDNTGPRIVLRLLEAEADALVGRVDFKYDGFDFVALLEDFG